MPRKPTEKKSTKRSTRRITKPKNLKFLEKVPQEYVFWCCDGRIFADMKELAEGLNTMSDETFVFHVNTEKNDFCNWVRDIIKDEELAAELSRANSRGAAVQCVAGRLIFLTE